MNNAATITTIRTNLHAAQVKAQAWATVPTNSRQAILEAAVMAACGIDFSEDFENATGDLADLVDFYTILVEDELDAWIVAA